MQFWPAPRTITHDSVIQGALCKGMWGLFPAGSVGKVTCFAKGAGFCHAVVSTEAEIMLQLPGRRTKGKER